MNAMIGRILPFTAIIVPFWLVRAMVSWSETIEVLPAILVVGISFASMQFFWSNKMDSNLVDITAGLFSLLCTVIFLLFWKPKKIWRFEDEGGHIEVKKAGSALPSVSGAANGPEIAYLLRRPDLRGRDALYDSFHLRLSLGVQAGQDTIE